MWVIKLGGSLLTTELLLPWLKALSHCNVLIVPGGGVFADAVRTMQQRWRFSEQAAHDMAILAMRQHGRMLADLAGLPVLQDCDRLVSFAGRAMVWLPDPDKLNQTDVPVSWNVTSDSLAAWLARRHNAEHLLLVKAASLPFTDDIKKPRLASRELVEHGLIDEAFPDFIRFVPFKTWLCSATDYAGIPEIMNAPVGRLLQIV